MTTARMALIAITATLVTATAVSAQPTTIYVPPGPCPNNAEWVKAAFWTSTIGVPCLPAYR